MSLRETIAAFSVTQFDFIYFSYGLAFLLLGAVGFAIARVRAQRQAWIMLGLFGFVHGASEWLDLTALVIDDSPGFKLVRIVVTAGSFLLLMEFARLKSIQFGARPMGRYLYVAMVALVALGWLSGGPAMAAAFARYQIGFFAALAASLIFFAHARSFSGAARRLTLITAAGFVLYAVAAGAIVYPAPFWPANTFNNAWFLGLTGIPIPLVRALLACLLAFSLWATWGQLQMVEVASDRYTAHLRQQFIWTPAAMALILVLGWMLTQFLGDIYKRNVEETAEGDIRLLASRLDAETAPVDGMVRALARSPAMLPLLSGGNQQEHDSGRAILDLDVNSADARLGAILDTAGNVVAISDGADTAEIADWPTATWFRKALGGEPDQSFAFDPSSRKTFYYASYAVRNYAGSIVGVAVLEKSLDGMEADLKMIARPYFLINPDGIVVQTNQPDMMLRPLWPLPGRS